MQLRPRHGPVRHVQAISPAVEDLAVAIRKELADQGWDHGPVTVRHRLQALGVAAPAVSTLARVFMRRGMVVPQPRKRPRSSYRRFTFAAVHECWQLDAFESRLADGTVRTVYQVLDDCSRFLLASHVSEGETSVGAIAVADKAIAAAGQAPCLFLTDNGTAFNASRRGRTSKLVVHLQALGTRPITGRPGHPQTQGKNERVHQTTQRWLRAQPVPETAEQLQRLLDDFDQQYNQHRAHQSLGLRTPAQARAAGPVAIPPVPPQAPASRPRHRRLGHQPARRSGRGATKSPRTAPSRCSGASSSSASRTRTPRSPSSPPLRPSPSSTPTEPTSAPSSSNPASATTATD